MKQIGFAPVPVRHSVGIVRDPISIYYESIFPLERTDKSTIIMLHGGSHSGSCYQLTIDGRPGWAYFFAQHGYPVFVLDWPGMGRSGTRTTADHTSEDVCQAVTGLLKTIDGPVVLFTHSMSGAFGWRLCELSLEKIAAVVAIAPGPPGNIQPIPEVMSTGDNALEVVTPFRTVRLETSKRVHNSTAFVETKLVGESRFFPKEAIDFYADSLLETPTALLKQRMNVEGSQVRVTDPTCFAGLPVLVVTGNEDLEHPRDEDSVIVDWLLSHGANARLLWLADRGIVGNGHMLMLETNSDQIAEQILEWLETCEQNAVGTHQ